MAVIYEPYGVALEVRVDFGCEDATPIVRCKQGDKKRIVRIYPRENGNEIITRGISGEYYFEPPFVTATLRMQRADGAMYTDTEPCEYKEIETEEGYECKLDYVEFALAEDMLEVAGRALCDFQLAEGEIVLSTASFYLDIEPKPTAKANGGVNPASFVNVKKISAADYATITPDANTLYIIIDGENVTLAFGSAVLSSGGGYNETQVDNITDSVEEEATG